MLRTSTFVLLVACALASTREAEAVTVNLTSCPAMVAPGVTAILQNDVTCTSGFNAGSTAILLESGAKLHLNGYTMTLDIASATNVQSIVRCSDRCEVLGPGLLTVTGGVASRGVEVDGTNGRGKIHDLDVSGTYEGIAGGSARLKVTNVSIAAVAWGIGPVSRLVLQNVTVSVTDAGGYCIGATTDTSGIVSGQDVVLNGCTDGIFASNKVRLTNLTLVNGTGIGVYGRQRIRLTNSSVTGSGNADLVSRRRPVLANTACDTSGVDAGDVITQSWGVCAND